MIDEPWKPVTFENCGLVRGPFYHGTRAELVVGDLLSPGYPSNYEAGRVLSHIYFVQPRHCSRPTAACGEPTGRPCGRSPGLIRAVRPSRAATAVPDPHPRRGQPGGVRSVAAFAAAISAA